MANNEAHLRPKSLTPEKKQSQEYCRLLFAGEPSESEGVAVVGVIVRAPLGFCEGAVELAIDGGTVDSESN